MKTYISPLDLQNQTDMSPFREQREDWHLPDQIEDAQSPLPDQRENWQIVPPIITDGRLGAVNPRHATSQEKYRQVPSSQETSTLFKVSFTGLDQQHYSVAATVRQPANRAFVEQEHVTSSKPFLRVPPTATLAQSSVHPAWQTAVSPTETAREWSPSELAREWSPAIGRTAAPPLTWQGVPVGQGVELGHPNIRNSERDNPAYQEQTKEEDKSKDFLLQVIQPSLVGLMDGSVSTLAPIFAVAFATNQPFTTFLVGMASALGAGISMAFSEALSDDGDLTGRGNPFLRGGITGLMTFLSGAGHALPFLVPDLQLALVMAYVVVAIELFVIAAIRHKFFGTSWWLSIVQVVGGGALVFGAAWLLGGG